jgi:hypothetical protein
MWEYEHSVETTASRETVWRLYADVEGWGTWDTGVEQITMHGPFAVGTEVSLTPTGQEPVRMRITDLQDNEQFTDETEFAGVTLRFIHQLACLDNGRTLVTHRVEVTGPGADQIGPAVAEDAPDAMAGLVKLAEALDDAQA